MLAVCLHVGRTEIANETGNRQSAALDTGGRTQQQGLGTSGDLGICDRVQGLLSKQAAGHRVCSLLDIYCRGTTRVGLFSYEVTIRAKEIMKNRANAKSLHLADNCFFKEK